MLNMKGKSAGLLFFVSCLGLAVLLLAGFITATVAGGIFAIALVTLGGLSRGFRR